MVILSLSDPGMRPTTLEFETPEAALDSLKPGAYSNYTSGMIEVDGKLRWFFDREVGALAWVATPIRPKAEEKSL